MTRGRCVGAPAHYTSNRRIGGTRISLYQNCARACGGQDSRLKELLNGWNLGEYMYRAYSPRMAADTVYYQICTRHIERLSVLESEMEALKQTSLPDFEETSEYRDLESEADECSAVVIVFAAMCLEAFIYDYGAVHTSDSFMDKYVDKLPPVAKWVVVPKIVTGVDFPRETQAFELMGKLMKARNDMVHFKSFGVPFGDEKKMRELINKPPLISAQDAYKTVSLVMTELRKIDPEYGRVISYIGVRT
jgi:hypothetical protein